MSEKLMLIDGLSILNRAFYGVPDLTNAEGIHTNAMYGFLNIMFKFLDEEKPDYLTVAFDVSAPTFRHKEYSEYKGTRKPAQPELKQQIPLIKEVLKSMNITIVEKEGFEADDLIGTIAKSSAQKGYEVSIVSGDRDLLQLAQDNIKIRIPKTKKGVTEVEDYLPKDVMEVYGVTPLEFIDVKALMGDASDNIPGAPGVGPKTATAIIAKYHSVENVFAHIDEVTPPKAKQSISENEQQVRMSRFLAEINIHVPLDYDINDSKVGEFFNSTSYELFKRFNFKSYLKRFEKTDINTSFDGYDNFKLIDDFSEAESVFNKAEQEITKGADIGFSVMYEDNTVYGISLAFSSTEVCFIPMIGFISDLYLSDKLNKLADIATANKKRQLITVDLKSILNVFGETCKEYAFADVALAAYLINPNNDGYEYDSIATGYLGINVNSRQELLGKMSLKEACFTNIEAVSKMACLMSYISYTAWDKVKERLISDEMLELYNDIEMPLLFVLHSMEVYGIGVDKESLAQYGNRLGERIGVLEKEIYEEAGEMFNINSPKQLGVILFEKMGMPNGKKTKSGYSTAAEVLDKLALDYPFVEKILEYRQLAKLKSTYADGLAGYIGDDGRIHGKFNQTITATGRISSTEPNLQNIPIRMELGKQIRKVFVPQEGCVFIDADYSQIELRILAHMSGDTRLIEAYNMAQDIHKTTASQVFGVPFEEVTDLQRRNAKAVNFGIIYGMSSFGLSQDLSISKKEADEYIKQYFATYPDIKGYIDGMVEHAKTTGYSLTMYKRRRPIPELKSSNYMQRSFGERVAMNAPIQGTAADIIKLAMIRVYNELKRCGLKSRLILQVHDELLVEAYKDELEQVKKIIEIGMKDAAQLSVALEIDMHTGNNWFEAH